MVLPLYRTVMRNDINFKAGGERRKPGVKRNLDILASGKSLPNIHARKFQNFKNVF